MTKWLKLIFPEKDWLQDDLPGMEEKIGVQLHKKQPGVLNRALASILFYFSLGFRFLLCCAFLLRRLILPGLSFLFRHTIKFTFVNY